VAPGGEGFAPGRNPASACLLALIKEDLALLNWDDTVREPAITLEGHGHWVTVAFP
jgi:hypothetical protein